MPLKTRRRVLMLCTCILWVLTRSPIAPAAPAAPQRTQSTRLSVDTLIEQLRSRHPSIRNTAAEGLVAWGPQAEPALPVLLDVMWDECCYDDRLGPALRAIGPRALAYLQAHLPDKEPGIHKIVEAIGLMGPDAAPAVPTLLDVLRSEDGSEYLRTDAARALVKIGPRAKDQAVPVLLARLSEPTEKGKPTEESWHMATALVELSADRAVPELKRLLKVDRPQVRGAAALALVGMARELESAEPVLFSVVSNADDRLRYVATVSMANLGRRMIMYAQFFADGTTHKSQNVSSESARALLEMGDAAIPTFLTLLKSSNATSRHRAVWGLGRLVETYPEQAPRLVLALRRALADSDSSVRSQDAFIFGFMGAKAAGALPDLQKVAESDPDSHVAQSARESIAKIRQAMGNGGKPSEE
jgi:HEAT repeat protein